MEIAEHLAALREQGELLATAAERVAPRAIVPGAPAWQVADLIRHVGLVHRWAAGAVRESLRDAAVCGSDDGADVTGAALVDRFRAGHRALLDTLTAADPRRSVLHLPAGAVAAGVLGPAAAHRDRHPPGRRGVRQRPVTPFPVAVALDGLDELVGGFGRRS